MAIGPSSVGTNPSASDTSGNTKKYTVALILLVTLFFMIGFITVLNDVLLPRLKSLFELSNRDAMLIMLVFFGAYLIWSYPAGVLIRKIGYKRGIILALVTVAIGLATFIPAAHAVIYGLFLLALFITASGLAILQVCINPYIIALGPEKTGAARLNLGGAMNSAATFIGPIIGGAFILQHVAAPDFPDPRDVMTVKQVYSIEKSVKPIANTAAIAAAQNIFGYKVVLNTIPGTATAVNNLLTDINEFSDKAASSMLTVIRPEVIGTLNNADFKRIETQAKDAWGGYKQKKADSVLAPYLGLCVATLLIALALVYIKLPRMNHEEPANVKKASNELKGSAFDYLHMKLGALAIFFYVGVEVSIGAGLILYLEEESMGGLSQQSAAYLLAYYWGSAMIGRFIGSYLGTKFSAQVMLRYVTVAALILLGLSYLPLLLNSWVHVPVIAMTHDPFSIGFIDVTIPLAALCLVLCGLCHSVMWPSIFPLGIAKLGKYTSQASGIMVMGVFGGAVIPLTFGWIADYQGYQISFLLCAVCYAYILFYSLKGYKMGPIADIAEGEALDTDGQPHKQNEFN
jgi:FHS family L-fucose permease-like MFS transporter